MDLSRINFMAAARCEFSPDEELRIMPEIKAPSTESFSSDWKSSCSISLTRSWLCGNYVSAMGPQESRNELPRGEGREQLVHDIVLIQLGPNILEGEITKSGQADLSERTIDDRILSKGCETNLAR